MPAYEFQCLDCNRKVTILLSYAEYDSAIPVCPKCGGKNLKRKITRVRFARSEESRLEAMSDPTAWGNVDENDPKSMARMMRKMGSELGEDLGPDFDEAVGRMEAGESPEEIEKTMPSLGGNNPMGGGMDEMGDDF